MNTIDNMLTLTILFSEGGAPVILNENDPRTENIRTIIHNPELTEEEAEALVKESLAKSAEDLRDEKIEKSDDFEVREGTVFYKKQKLPKALSDTVFKMIEEGHSNLTRFKKFVERLYLNPSAKSIEQLFDYISMHGCPINEDGLIVAWKSVDSNGWSHHGNEDTIVETGETNKGGKILNKIGEEIRVNRNQVDDDRNEGCSFGLHAGSYSYASGFYGGVRLLTVTIDPVDVVSIPHCSSCAKMRVCAYLPIELSKGDITQVAVDTNSGTVEEPKTEEERIKAFVVDGYLNGLTYEIREVIVDLMESEDIGTAPTTILEIVKAAGCSIDRSYPSVLDWEFCLESESDDEDLWEMGE